jgi:hypothetical protein
MDTVLLISRIGSRIVVVPGREDMIRTGIHLPRYSSVSIPSVVNAGILLKWYIIFYLYLGVANTIIPI